MNTYHTLTSIDVKTEHRTALAEILGFAVKEPANMDEAREVLNTIEDLAKIALFGRRA